jgi:hypothetical protein
MGGDGKDSEEQQQDGERRSGHVQVASITHGRPCDVKYDATYYRVSKRPQCNVSWCGEVGIHEKQTGDGGTVV